MCTKIIRVFLIAVVVAIFSEATSSSASATVFTLAAVECTGGTHLNLCYENITTKKLVELEGKQSFTVALLGNLVLKGTVAGEEVAFTCEETTVGVTENLVSQTTPLAADSVITGHLVFKKCKVTGNAAIVKKCTIPAEKESEALTGVFTSETELLVKPTGETAFIAFPFSNNGTEVCPATISGSRAVSGEQVLTIAEPGVPAEEKTANTVVKSGLKYSGAPAELTAKLDLTLTGLGDLWYVSKMA